MNWFLILDEMGSLCNNELIKAAVGTVKTIFTIIQFVVPAVLIVLCGIDMFKAMTSGDEKKTKETQKTCIRRLVYALIVFLIIPLLSLIMSAIGSVIKIDNADQANATFQTFIKCWNGTDGGTSDSGNSNNNQNNNSTSYCTCRYSQNGVEYDAGYIPRSQCVGGNYCVD